MNVVHNLKTLKPYGLYIILSLIAFFPCLLLGRTYFANDLLYFFGPMRAFLRDQLFQGHFPLWNPYIFCGQPFFADLQNMMLYPLTYPTLLFPTGFGLNVFLSLHFLLAACGMHFWLKTLKLSPSASVIGGFLYACSGFFWQETIHPPVIAAFACLPWFMSGLEKLSQSLKWQWALSSGVFFALLFCAGSFQVTLGAFYGGLIYFLFRFIPQNHGSSSIKDLWASAKFRKSLILSLLLLTWGALPLLAQLIPTMEFSRLSVRRLPNMTYDDFNSSFSLQPSNLLQFIFPTFSLDPGQSIEQAIQTVRNGGDVDFLGNFGYLGLWAPLLIILGLRLKDKRTVFYLLFCGSICVLVAFGKYFFLHRLFCGLIPGFNIIRAPFRFLYFYILCASALAAFGFQYLEKCEDAKERPPFLFTGLVIGATALCLFSFLRFENAWRETLSSLLGLAGLALWLQTQSWKKLGKFIFVSALLFPLLVYGWTSWTTGSLDNYDFEKNSVMSVLRPPQGGRVVVQSDVPYLVRANQQTYDNPLPINSLIPLHIRTNSGYDPLHIKKIDDLGKISIGLSVGLMALEELVCVKDQGEIPGFTQKTMGSYHIYENPDFGYVRALTQFLVVPTEQGQLKVLQEPSFSYKNKALLFKAPPAVITQQLLGQKAQLQAQLTAEQPDWQSFKINLDVPSLVVFSELFYPGWKASLDGIPIEIYNIDYAFRGLFIPAGDHLVEFKYQPFWWPLVCGGLVLWFFSIPLLWWLNRKH